MKVPGKGRFEECNKTWPLRWSKTLIANKSWITPTKRLNGVKNVKEAIISVMMDETLLCFAYCTFSTELLVLLLCGSYFQAKDWGKDGWIIYCLQHQTFMFMWLSNLAEDSQQEAKTSHMKTEAVRNTKKHILWVAAQTTGRLIQAERWLQLKRLSIIGWG